MFQGKRIAADADWVDAERPERPELPPARPGRPARPWRRQLRRLPAATAWAAGCVALFALYLRISFTGHVTADAANNALQAWDMLHGHILLHGWILGAATYYTFELPVLAVTEIFFGLGDLTSHVGSALTYLIVTVSAVAVALTGSRGLARVARCAVVVLALTVMFHVSSNAPYLLGTPDHTGTSAFLLVCFLLVDRSWRYTPALLLPILIAGQIGDATVSYVAVPAVVAVCVYRLVAARKLRTADAANALAAAASVPLAHAVRAVMLHFGGYQLVPPRTAISPWRQWPRNAALTWQRICVLFGAVASPGHASAVRDAGYILGLACLVAAAVGFARVACTWPTASRAEQLLCVAIVINVCEYLISTLPPSTGPYEIAAVLPCGAVLAARAFVPGQIGRLRSGLTAALVAAAALLPLTSAAVQPVAPAPTAPLSTWLEAHGLTYGLAGYWNSSIISLRTDNRVQVRAVALIGNQILRYYWETNTSWYDPSRHDATFVIVDLHGNGLYPWAEQYFGKPAESVRVAHWEILIYRKNVLKQVMNSTKVSN